MCHQSPRLVEILIIAELIVSPQPKIVNGIVQTIWTSACQQAPRLSFTVSNFCTSLWHHGQILSSISLRFCNSLCNPAPKQCSKKSNHLALRRPSPAPPTNNMQKTLADTHTHTCKTFESQDVATTSLQYLIRTKPKPRILNKFQTHSDSFSYDSFLLMRLALIVAIARSLS